MVNLLHASYCVLCRLLLLLNFSSLPKLLHLPRQIRPNVFSCDGEINSLAGGDLIFVCVFAWSPALSFTSFDNHVNALYMTEMVQPITFIFPTSVSVVVNVLGDESDLGVAEVDLYDALVVG